MDGRHLQNGRVGEPSSAVAAVVRTAVPARVSRIKRELEMLRSSPPAGVAGWPARDRHGDELLGEIEARIVSSEDSAYRGAEFSLYVTLPQRYPFEPPSVRFETPVYHPNIDADGRICLDLLNMPPKGAWKPSLNVPTVLASIQLLLAEPNPDDPLVQDIAAQLVADPAAFRDAAFRHARAHATFPEKPKKQKSDAGT
ncbi:Ubiquitin-conjugating enzyme E2 T [Porphyridium purpureum]|uniref:Ubiquitin-conjugating enzyme E2 T n=1 Tax=Porphyridium purpureum TaxID=35688 RepID=A0A5J4YZ81_PORPP|nr:Ubiquitin-conjugating enzyme E2 T [Porphyridium purpureum]|eukprot:POR7490..scf208_2